MNLTFFTNIFYPVFYFIFIIDYIRTFYPEYFNTIIVKVALVSIRLFSRGELFYIKCKKVLSKKYINLLESNPQLASFVEKYLSNSKQTDVDFIVNGKIVYSTTKESLLNSGNLHDETYSKIPTNYELIIYSKTYKNNENTNITCKKVLSTFPVEDKHFDIIKADYRFLLTEIVINDKIIKTNFAYNIHNYFVVDNLINASFIKYYLNQYHKNDINIECLNNFDYKVRALDQNVNEISFDKENQLKINKENYEINKI